LSQVVRGLRSDWSPPAAAIVGRAASQAGSAVRRHVRLESMVPYHPRAVGCAQGARVLNLTQVDTPFAEKSSATSVTPGVLEIVMRSSGAVSGANLDWGARAFVVSADDPRTA
jgi:hypothetical protein